MAIDTVFAIVTASLVVQLLVLGLLVYGYILKRRLKFRRHGFVMATAVILHISIILYIMLPSFIRAILPEFILPNPFSAISLLSILHEILGAPALALGLWFVVSWRFRKNFAGCFGKKRFMLATIWIWAAALASGIALYSILNWQILMGT